MLTKRARAIVVAAVLAIVGCGGGHSSSPGESGGGALDFGKPVPAIETDTPAAGGGTHPKLTWHAVDGTDTYVVMLFDGSGETKWAWQGHETSVVVADPQIPDDGVAVNDGDQWAVMATNDQAVPIAASKRRAIGP